MRKTSFIYSSDYLNHETGEHPESPSRLLAIIKSLEKNRLHQHLISVEPPLVSQDQISLVHQRDYIRMVETACQNRERYLDADTMISEKSYQTALLAAGGVITAIDLIVSGKSDNAFCAVRPPGHHAEHDRAMGFCLFNNIAIGAQYALKKKGLKKVFIIDWDVHHGNGTQNIFYNSSLVFYVSLHQFPHYPGTGHTEEKGSGKGEGFTRNFPLVSGSGDTEYCSLFEKKISPLIRNYLPDLILISAGFDAHTDDPLSSTTLTSKGFQRMTEYVVRVAEEVCEGRIVSVLEGGYNLDALGESTAYHLAALLGI